MEKMTDDQSSQMRIIRSFLQKILEQDEIPLNGRYYLKNNPKDNHWIWTKLELKGQKDGELYFLFPNGITRNATYHELNNIYIII